MSIDSLRQLLKCGCERAGACAKGLTSTMNTFRFYAALLTILATLWACTTTGVGDGQLSGLGTEEAPVAFSWISKDGGITGTMTAAMPDAAYTGRFFQITQQTRSETLEPLWSHWHNGWYDWPYWGGPFMAPYPTTRFVTHYSGKVVATLEAAGQQHMRCRFHLADPASGMSGGGEGECQLTDGRVVRAVFANR